jgi:hypothetical protein
MPETYTRQGHVYFARVEGSNLYKIGVSSDPGRRMSEFGPPCKLVHTVETYAPRKVESALLDLFSDHITEGEWIECGGSTCSEVITEMNSRKLDERPSVNAPTTPAHERAGRKRGKPRPTTSSTVRHGSTLSYEELKDKAHELAKDGPTYAELAESLDVSENAVAKAVTTTGPKFQRLQMRIVELLSDYEVEQRQGFILHPKDK